MSGDAPPGEFRYDAAMAEVTSPTVEVKQPSKLTIVWEQLKATFDVPKEIEDKQLDRVRVELTILDKGNAPFAAITYVVAMPDDSEKLISGGAKMLMPL